MAEPVPASDDILQMLCTCTASVLGLSGADEVEDEATFTSLGAGEGDKQSIVEQMETLLGTDFSSEEDQENLFGNRLHFSQIAERVRSHLDQEDTCSKSSKR